ncbi:MAG: leucine-rich repeat domain-containing protein [Limisphaerales bacterium]
MLSQKSGKRGARLTVRRLNRLIVGAAFCLVLVVASGNAQNATINWYRVANGGGVSTGNGCTLIGTVGQAEPGIVRAGSVALAEGFWSADAVLAPNGSLQVTLAPAGAASAGAQWQVDGGLWQSSGDTVPDLAVGSHTVAFSAVSGWITPPRQTVTITDNNTATPTGTYVIGGFSFTVNSTAITITGYSGPGGVLAIPSTLVGVNGTVTAIGQNAFQGIYGLTSVIIPEGVTSIGEEAFEGCSDLTGLSIPSSVTFIGDAAFEGCHSLPDVNIPTNVTSIGMETFENCTGMMSVTIPNGVTSIGEDAFYGCSGLTSVTLPNSVTSIGVEAFRACSSLTDLTIPTGVTFIEISAFYDCSGLTSVTIPSSVTAIGQDAFLRCTGLTALSIPNSVTSIGDNAFYGCSSMASVSIPTNITSIGEGTFSGCYSLASVSIPNSVTSIGDDAFYGCSGLANLTIPNSVNSIGLEAFQACYSLTHVTLPSSITSIGEDAFYGCSDLASLSIPSSVTSIGQDAFRACSSLTNVTIPSSVTSIGKDAFLYCTGLTSMTIPASVTSIGDYAFCNCAGLTAAYFQGNAPAFFGNGVFDGDAAGFTVYYPANATGFTTPTWNGYHAVPNSSAQVPALLLAMNIQKAFYLTSTNLTVGLKYQVQGSPDLSHWENQGTEFTAASSIWQSTSDWNVGDFHQFFFRLQVVQ